MVHIPHSYFCVFTKEWLVIFYLNMVISRSYDGYIAVVTQQSDNGKVLATPCLNVCLLHLTGPPYLNVCLPHPTGPDYLNVCLLHPTGHPYLNVCLLVLPT